LVAGRFISSDVAKAFAMDLNAALIVTPRSIPLAERGDKRSSAMEELHGLRIPRTLEDACDPPRLALVVYDMQAGILSQISDRERVLGRVVVALEAARGAGVRTLFTRHVTLPTELMGAATLRMWMKWQRVERAADVVSPFPPAAAQTQLVDGLEPTDREAVLDKIGMSAYEGTPLDLVLRDCGVVAVAFAGVALEIGIEPSVRHAADLGYLPIVLTDACGAGDANAGERSLASLDYAGDAILTDVASFSSALVRP
jgi:nicotinamidase-related amidase